MINRLIYFILILFFFFTSCAIRLHKRTQPKPEVTASSEKETEAQLSSAVTPRYRLGFGDVIEVKFFNNEKFNETLTVRPDGRISMQKVGDIPVTGMTPMELSRVIDETYSKIIKNPEVTVIVRNFGGYQLYVLGEVKSPGAFPVQRNMTILQALASAGGQKETAKLKSILLMRRNDDGTVAATRLDLSGPSPESIQENDLHVAAYDIIYVPKTFIANVNAFLDQAFSGVIQPLDVYLRAVWYYQK
ncbi:MAG TPA: polysaccharide biosynthesis/export family protein [bacterium]